MADLGDRPDREWHEFDCGPQFGDKPHWHPVTSGDRPEMPQADWASAWTVLRGYVEQAKDEGGVIYPQNMLFIMDDLKRQTLRPITQWLKGDPE